MIVSTTTQECWCRRPHVFPFSNSWCGISCLLQIPTVVGESRALCSVERATRSCFQGVSAMQMTLGAGGEGGMVDTVAGWFKLQTCTPHDTPGNLIEEVNLPLTFRVMNFFSRADRNRTRKEEENTFSSILETNIISRNTSKYTFVFQVLSSAIKEEKFLSWLQSEPPILLWLPTCYRLSATTEMVTHPVRCRICRNFPITGLRYSHSPLWHGQSFSKWL